MVKTISLQFPRTLGCSSHPHSSIRPVTGEQGRVGELTSCSFPPIQPWQEWSPCALPGRWGGSSAGGWPVCPAVGPAPAIFPELTWKASVAPADGSQTC